MDLHPIGFQFSLFSRAEAQEFTLVAGQLCACVDGPLVAYGV